MNLLHVSPETLEVYGAVSEQTVIEMVKGAMKALKPTALSQLQELPVPEVEHRRNR